MPLTTPEPPGTSVLLIDANDTDRAFYVEELKRCSSDYLILETTSGESGRGLYRQSPRIDCVVLDIDLPGESGIVVLTDLIPIAKRPRVAVIVLTNLEFRGLGELVTKNGAYAWLPKRFTSGEDLHRAIQRAVAFVGLMPKEDRHRII
ncbi:MAG TPA: response regulator [Nitrospiraceae bacterium]|nr:response regulator [Nitrospiraceae bacterium]